MVLSMATFFTVAQAQIPTLKIDETQARKNEKEREMEALFGYVVSACLHRNSEDIQLTAKAYLESYPNNTENNVYIKKCFESHRIPPNSIPEWLTLCSQKKFKEFLPMAKDILSRTPDYLPVLICVWQAGFHAVGSNDFSQSEEFISYGKHTLNVLKTDRSQTYLRPFKDKDEAIGYVNFLVGLLYSKTDSHAAIDYLYESTQHNSIIRTNSAVYSQLAVTYQKIFKEMTGNVSSDNAQTPEEKEKINHVLDCQIDALARAVFYEKDSVKKSEWKRRLTEAFLIRNKNQKGIEDYIAKIENKKMPKIELPFKQ